MSTPRPGNQRGCPAKRRPTDETQSSKHATVRLNASPAEFPLVPKAVPLALQKREHLYVPSSLDARSRPRCSHRLARGGRDSAVAEGCGPPPLPTTVARFQGGEISDPRDRRDWIIHPICSAARRGPTPRTASTAARRRRITPCPLCSAGNTATSKSPSLGRGCRIGSEDSNDYVSPTLWSAIAIFASKQRTRGQGDRRDVQQKQCPSQLPLASQSYCSSSMPKYQISRT